MRTASGRCTAGCAFQSAPGREAGRCAATRCWKRCCTTFQSAPGREAGRCQFDLQALLTPFEFQSAPGREAGRCVRRHSRSKKWNCFNPRPAVRPGDAQVNRWPAVGKTVSIRARP